MKKSGFIMLLLVCLLAFMPVVAFAHEANNEAENLFTSFDPITKIVAQEEVAVYFNSEILTDFSASPIDAVAVENIMIIANSGIELDLGIYKIIPGLLKPESVPYIKDC